MRFYPLVMVVAAGKTDPLPSLDAAGSVMLADVQLFCVVLVAKLVDAKKAPNVCNDLNLISLLPTSQPSSHWLAATCPISKRRCPRGR